MGGDLLDVNTALGTRTVGRKVKMSVISGVVTIRKDVDGSNFKMSNNR